MLARRLSLAGALAFLWCSPPALADDRFDRLVQQVERIRQLKFEAKVPWQMRTQEAMGSRLKEEATQDAPSADEKALSHFLRRLGMVPAGFDVRAFLVSLYSDQVRGLYDPEDKTLYVVGKGEAPAEGFTLEEVVSVHELAHALQDQHFDLQAYHARTAKAGSDETLAARGLVEGEAELVGMDYALGASGMSADHLGSQDKRSRTGHVSEGKLAEAPLYFRRLLRFPYDAGMDFVLYVRKAGGWELVSRMYQDPPSSTEQVMHPDRYLDRRDVPVRVVLNLPPQIGGFSQLAEDVGGEFTVSAFLEQHLGYQESLAGASGWGGDAWRVYTRGEEDFALWFTHWDSEGEARQFSQAARQAFRKAKVADAVVEDRGQDVVLYLGVPDSLRPQISAQVDRVALDPVRRTVLVTRPAGGTGAAAQAVEPEIKENRYLVEQDAFRSVTHGFLLPVPSGWVPQPRKGDVRMPVVLVRLAGAAQVLVQVVRLPRDTSQAPPTDKEIARNLAEQVAKALPGLEPVASRTLPGQAPFVEVEFAGLSERVSAFQGEALGRTYTVILRADAASYPAARKELTAALRGMKFGPPGQF